MSLINKEDITKGVESVKKHSEEVKDTTITHNRENDNFLNLNSG